MPRVITKHSSEHKQHLSLCQHMAEKESGREREKAVYLNRNLGRHSTCGKGSRDLHPPLSQDARTHTHTYAYS